MALEQAGMTANDVSFVILPFDQQELALEQGQVDAIGLMQPYVLHSKENENNQVLFTALDVFGEKQFCTHVLNNVWAKYNKEKAQAFVTSIAQAAEWIEQNQEEAKTIISKYTGVDGKYIEDYHFQPHAQVNIEDAQYWLSYMKKQGEIKADWLTTDAFATNEYNITLQQ
jgi:NitT/TauT family transport system substrate-binding protein